MGGHDVDIVSLTTGGCGKLSTGPERSGPGLPRSPHNPSMATHDGDRDPVRFLTIADTAELLNLSTRQVYALVRSGELPAVRLGSQRSWRVERSVLDGYIAAKYEEARRSNAWHEAQAIDVPDLFAPRQGPGPR